MSGTQVPSAQFFNSESRGEDERSRDPPYVKNITGVEWKEIFDKNEEAKDKITLSQFLDVDIKGQTSKKNVREKGKKRQNSFQNVTSETNENFYDMLPHAKMYQEYMKVIPIPKERIPEIPYRSWCMLGKSIKQKYKQPLHYRTNVMLNDWDKGRIGTERELVPMDQILHPYIAEGVIWIVEENHRALTSSEYLAKLWVKDPMYQAFVDPKP